MWGDLLPRPLSIQRTLYVGTQIGVSRFDVRFFLTENSWIASRASATVNTFIKRVIAIVDQISILRDLNAQNYCQALSSFWTRWRRYLGMTLTWERHDFHWKNHANYAPSRCHSPRVAPSPPPPHCTYGMQRGPMSRSQCTYDRVYSTSNKLWHGSNGYNHNYSWYCYYTMKYDRIYECI
jgi:hypothetical protein